MPLNIPSAQLKAFQDRLNEQILQALPRAKFNANTIANQQLRRIALLPNHPAAYHSGWNSLDIGRRSTACCFEWARLQLFMAAEVLPLLRRSRLDFFHLTVVDKRWRVVPSFADRKCFDRPRRKVRAAIDLLRREGYSPIHIAAYELSGDRNLDGNYCFEPHVHVLIGGVPKAALQIAFDLRQPRSERGHHKPVKAPQIAMSELPNVLSYITKIKAQDRVKFVGSDGRARRKANHMRSSDKLNWLRCMATMPVTHAIQFGGFAEPLTSRFTHLEMATMLGEIQ